MSLTHLLAEHRASLVASTEAQAAPALESIPMSAVLSGDTVAALEDLTTAVEELGELDNVFTGMEAILATLESHKTNPLTEREVQYLNLAVEGYVGKYGMTAALVPSIESAGSIDDLVASTESRIGDMLRAAWKWIIETAKRIKAFVAEFFERLFSEAKRLEVRGKKLHDRARATKGTRKHTYIKLGSMANRLMLDGKVTAPEDCLDSILASLDTMKNAPAGIEKLTGTVTKAGEAVAAAKTVEAYQGAAETVKKAIKDFIQGTMKVSPFDVKDGKAISKELPGGVTFEYTAATGRTERKVSEVVAPADAQLEVSTLIVLAATGSKASKLGTAAHSLSKAGKAKVERWGFDKMAAPAPLDTAPKELVEAAQEAVKAIREATSDISVAWNSVSAFVKQCVQSAMASLAVAEKMVAQYEAEAPAK